MSNRITFNNEMMFPARFANAADLQGRPYTVEIARITRERVTNPDPRVMNDRTLTPEQKLIARWVIWFGAARRGFVLGDEFAQSIADALKTTNANTWIGQRVEIFPAKSHGRDCVRARIAPNGVTPLPASMTEAEDEEGEP